MSKISNRMDKVSGLLTKATKDIFVSTSILILTLTVLFFGASFAILKSVENDNIKDCQAMGLQYKVQDHFPTCVNSDGQVKKVFGTHLTKGSWGYGSKTNNCWNNGGDVYTISSKSNHYICVKNERIIDNW